MRGNEGENGALYGRRKEVDFGVNENVVGIINF